MTVYTIRVRRRKVDWHTDLRWEWMFWEQPQPAAVIAHGITYTRRGARRAARRYAELHHRNRQHFNDQEETIHLTLT